MTAEGTWVQGDTSPDMVGVLHAKDSLTTIIDLTSAASVNFQMRKADDKHYTVNQPADVVGSPADGRCRYEWGVNDLSVPGTYWAQWEVTFNDGKVQTTVAREIEVRRQ